MRLIALALFVFAGCGAASAQTADCRTISVPAARLACYDKATPPVAAPREPQLHPNPYRSKVSSEKYMESLGAEDAQLTVRMNGICRGC